MPGRAVRQLRFLDKQDFFLGKPGKVIGDRTADRTAPDDDDLCFQALAPAASVFTYQRTKASTLYSLYFE
jgi:hypothetical protein